MVTSIFSFSKMVFKSFSAQCCLILFHTIWQPWEISLSKMLCEKEKVLVTSIFSFSHNIFYPFQNQFQHFIHVLFCGLQMFSIWTSLKFCPLVKGWEFWSGLVLKILSSSLWNKDCRQWRHVTALWQKKKLLIKQFLFCHSDVNSKGLLQHYRKPLELQEVSWVCYNTACSKLQDLHRIYL